MTITPEQFIQTWQANDLTERAGAQAFIEDLCELLGLEKPRSSEDFCYEKGAVKDSGRRGWADVWKKDHFAWENKKPGRNLTLALAQLREYSGFLGNPPLLIVCDRERIEIHTAFNGYPDETRTILLPDIGSAENLQILKWVFTEPIKLRPEKSSAAITEEASAKFAKLADDMRARGLSPQRVAHFLSQCIFCMFAENEGLLNESPTQNTRIFANLLKSSRSQPERIVLRLQTLFTAMQNKGGIYGDNDIAWFNGGLFEVIDIPELTFNDIAVLFRAAQEFDWRAIDPTIFGTLFERGLDPSKRSQLGAHYTDVSTIKKLIDPLISRPLREKWQTVKAEIKDYLAKAERVKSSASKNKYLKAAQNLYHGYLDELHNFRVLDAACGSGNFLYLALHTLKDLEHTAQLDGEALGFEKQLLIETGTQNVLGIETNEYAAELARVTVWIGDIQWSRRNGREFNRNPILNSLNTIEQRDALINPDGSEAQWPETDVIVGNPPFLGQRFQLKELEHFYIKRLRSCYEGRVSGNADLVCYWFDKARKQIEEGQARAAGLVSTNSIRGGANREVLDAIVKTMPIFEAWPDEDWFDKGTAVRVSLTCFGHNPLETKNLNGQPVALIYSNLTGVTDLKDLDLSRAKSLAENLNLAYSGFKMNGSFDVDGDTARWWFTLKNVNHLPNSKVVRPYVNAKDIVGRDRGQYVIDFTGMTKEEASLFEMPFNWVEKEVKLERKSKREKKLQEDYWLHERPRPAMNKAINGLKRFIATPMVSKYRLFVWLPEIKTPENAAIVIARADDTTLGILQSRFHEVWSLALGTSLEDRPRYTPTTCFETFPFPEGLTPADTNHSESKITILDSDKPTPAPVKNPEKSVHAQAIAEIAFKLNDYREKWLNPPEWMDWVITPEEEAAGFPKRPKAKAGQETNLKKRTLTNLYNARPAWLNSLHEKLDKAVAAAYGWDDYTPDMTDAEILQRLLKLNLNR